MTSRWDYGWIRMGGTIGYAFMAVAAGYILKDQYASIFMLIAGSLVLFFLFFQIAFLKLRRKPLRKTTSSTAPFMFSSFLSAIAFT